LYCHSEQREKKEAAIRSRFHQRFEQALEKLHQGLPKKGTIKRYEKVLETIGRIKQANSRVAQDYDIEVSADANKKNATSITFKRAKNSHNRDKLSGVYCLRSNSLDWSEEQLWETYVMLTELEATFRSLKTELGLRPIYHQKEGRVTAHLWITLLAYHLVHTLRYQLKKKGINLSWQGLRQILSTVQRITLSMPTKDNERLYMRTTTKLEPMQQKIFNALNLSADPIGNVKTIINKTKKSVVPT